MLLDLAALFAGCALLYFGGEWIVDGARSLASRFDVSTLLVSVVLVGFGTSAPELFVSVIAAHQGHFDIAIGNVVGSNIANLLLILAVAALITPVFTTRRLLVKDGAVSLAATAALVVCCLNGVISRLEGAILVVALIAFVIYRLRSDGRDHGHEPARFSLKMAVLLSVVGLAALQLGAHLFVAGAAGLALALGISQAVIGLTVVAVGTSLPELAACISAARQRHTDVVLGNILGSNIFNSTVVVGAASFWAPMAVSPRFLSFDLWLMLLVTIVALVFMRTAYRLSRPEALIMLAAYAAYVFFLGVSDLPIVVI